MQQSFESSLQRKARERLARLEQQQRIRESTEVSTFAPRLFDYLKGAWSVLEPGRKLSENWHQELICEHLEAVHLGQCKRLLINIAPRHLKSTIASVAFPTWEWIEQPWMRYLFLSYSQRLSNKLSLKRRSLIRSSWYQSHWGDSFTLSPDNDQKTEFSNNHQGQMFASSLGGTVMGEGGEGVIVDDPHDPEAADSDAQRETTLEAFNEAIGTRLNDPENGFIVVIMQRVHDLDVSGHVLSEIGGYTHLCLPTEAEEFQTLYFPLSGREVIRTPGDMLHPDRFPQEKAREAERILGSYGYAGRHQQRPVPREGGMIKAKWFQRYRTPPAQLDQIVLSLDTASKAAEINCPWAAGVWGIKNGLYYLLYCLIKRMEYPEGKRTIANLMLQWKPDVCLIEDKSTGQSLIQEYRTDGIEDDQGGRHWFSIIPIQPCGDKITRMSTNSPTIEAGRVLLPESAGWLPEYELSLTTFPKSAISDPVDMTSQFLAWVKGHEVGSDWLDDL